MPSSAAALKTDFSPLPLGERGNFSCRNCRHMVEYKLDIGLNMLILKLEFAEVIRWERIYPFRPFWEVPSFESS